jgi:glycosyltransferase involved in cell wall biosynthesis
LPSHQENFGIAVAETLACGRPVLISDQVNIWREIKDAGAALVQPDSVAATTKLFLDWAHLSESARETMAAKAKPCFENNFSNESAGRKLLKAIS